MSNTTPAPAVVLSTEVWNTKSGKVVKAVARTTEGTFIGATNQTAAISPVVVGRR